MMSILMDMAMLHLFGGRLTQTHYFHIEVQLIAGQRMIEIQSHCIAVDRVDAGITRLPGIIPDG